MLARIFVPGAAVVTIGTVAAVSSGWVGLAFPVVAVVAPFAIYDIHKENAQIAAINEASTQALQEYKKIRTPDMPPVLPLAKFPDMRHLEIENAGPKSSYAMLSDGSTALLAQPILRHFALHFGEVITLAGPNDCFGNDFVGVHISSDLENWTFVGVGPQNNRFLIDREARHVLITPLHHQLCVQGHEEPFNELDGAGHRTIRISMPLYAGYWTESEYQIHYFNPQKNMAAEQWDPPQRVEIPE